MTSEQVKAPPEAPIRYSPSAIRSPWALVIALGTGVFVGGFDQSFVVPVQARILSDLEIPIN